MLTGSAMRQLENSLPALSPAARDRALDTALAEASARGVTTVHHVGPWQDVELFLRAQADARLPLRVYAAVPLTEWRRLDRAISVGTFGGPDDRGADRLRVGAVHVRLDGALACPWGRSLGLYSAFPILSHHPRLRSTRGQTSPSRPGRQGGLSPAVGC